MYQERRIGAPTTQPSSILLLLQNVESLVCHIIAGKYLRGNVSCPYIQFDAVVPRYKYDTSCRRPICFTLPVCRRRWSYNYMHHDYECSGLQSELRNYKL